MSLATKNRKRARDDSDSDNSNEPKAKRAKWTLCPCANHQPIIYSKSDFAECEVQEVLDAAEFENADPGFKVRMITEVEELEDQKNDENENNHTVTISLSYREASYILKAINAALDSFEEKNKPEVLGYIMTTHDEDSIHIEYLDVFKENRGRGIGAEIVQQIRQEAGSDRTVTAYARQDAIGFWNKARGFTSCKTSPKWYSANGISS